MGTGPSDHPMSNDILSPLLFPAAGALTERRRLIDNGDDKRVNIRKRMLRAILRAGVTRKRLGSTNQPDESFPPLFFLFS